MQKFTSDHLLLHIFGETPPGLSPAIEEAITLDSRLNQEYQDIYQTLLEVDEFELAPNDKVLQRVLYKFRQKKDTHIAS